MDRYIENKRLTALSRSGLLSTRSNDALRRIVEAARQDFAAAFVSVSIMDEDCLRPVEISGAPTTPIPCRQAFCSATVALDQMTVVLDASIDPRWADNPFVQGEAHVRFYAGVPLRFQGQPVGTFCIADSRPRDRFGDVERQRLHAYASAMAEAMSLIAEASERRSNETRFEQLAAVTPDAMLIRDAEGRILFSNRRAQDLFGYTEEEFLGLRAADLLPERTRYVPGDCQAMFDTSVGMTREIDILTKAGDIRTVEFSLARWIEDGAVRYGSISRDVSERKIAQATLIEMAHRDGLTGLPNRTVLQARLREALSNGHVSVLLVDLDGFKDVNDKFGHAAGDEVLRIAAERLRSCVDPCATVARMGGDEFAVILPGVGDPLVSATLAKRIVCTLEQPFGIDDGDVRLGASVGVAIGPTHGSRVETVLKNADTALYQAKAEGRHRHALYTPALIDANAERVRFGQEFHRAIRDGEFVLHYQPQVHLADGSVIGAEALLRWQHPALGLLQPAAFLSALLASRFEGAIGEWVLRQACAQAASWRALGHSSFRMGINASATHIRSGDIAVLTREILRDCGLPPGNLEIEITETVMIGDDEQALAALTALRSIGVGIAFDDYGTGYASLSMLKKYPLTRLKIDRSFVREMKEVADVTIIRAILQLAKGFGLDVIAEGVETEDQRRRLRGKGCSEAQGYLFGKPMPAAEFERRFLRPHPAISPLSA